MKTTKRIDLLLLLPKLVTSSMTLATGRLINGYHRASYLGNTANPVHESQKAKLLFIMYTYYVKSALLLPLMYNG